MIIKDTKRKKFNIVLPLIDAAVIYVSYFFAMYFKFGNVTQNIVYSGMVKVLPLLVISGFILLYIYDLYDDVYLFSLRRVVSVLSSMAMLVAVTVLYTFLNKEFVFSRYVIVYAYIIQSIGISIIRVITMYVVKGGSEKQKVLVIGEGQGTEVAAIKIIQNESHIYEVKYIIDVDEYSLDMECRHIPLIDEVDIVVVCSGIDYNKRANIMSQCVFKMKKVFIIPELHEISIENMVLNQIGDIPLFFINELGLTEKQRIVKRIFDILFSTCALIGLSPLLLIIALAIKLDSKGPVFFLQERVTINNKVFKVVKFRTMVEDAEKLSGPTLALEEDPRITKIGKLLRMTRLDEIPQFINVFIGDMSIVGPRPERMYFINQFKEELPEFEYRVFVKAGITGMAQVSGKYNTTPVDKLRYDLFYIKNYSFMFDLELIIKTLGVVLKKESTEGLKDQEEDLNDIIGEIGYVKVDYSSYCELVPVD